jgi:pilus assembly protein CpaF
MTTEQSQLDAIYNSIIKVVERRISKEEAKNADLASTELKIRKIIGEWLSLMGKTLSPEEQGIIVQRLMTDFLNLTPKTKKTQIQTEIEEAENLVDKSSWEAYVALYPGIMNRIDSVAASKMRRPELEVDVQDITSQMAYAKKIVLTQKEKKQVVDLILDDMLGLGPLELVLKDPTVTEILINNAKNCYYERAGKLRPVIFPFRDESHLRNIATRIANNVNRRIDEKSPMVDARLADGSRVNIIIHPLAMDGTSISIRKFSVKGITLSDMVASGSISAAMERVLDIAAKSRMNIMISGGTGSGKTTLLNALSQSIWDKERLITIEDSAELKLQQPHVVRLETRPANLEGEGEINIRDLVRNALRMRPDRIIVGECRGGEIVDMIQAMNTGHDGSMSTVHANSPRKCLMRMENMLTMSGFDMPEKTTRAMVAYAVNLIVQVSRMRDGHRRITHITEITGLEDNTIVTQDLFVYRYQGTDSDGKLKGEFVSTKITPNFVERASYYDLGDELRLAMQGDLL